MDSLDEIPLQPGSAVLYLGKPYQIRQLTGNRKTVVLESPVSGRRLKVPIAHLSLPVKEDGASAESVVSLESVSEEDWVVARQRLAIIQPMLANKGNGQAIQDVAKQHSVGPATLYRWLVLFETTGQLSSLIPRRRGAKRGQSRLAPEVEALVQASLDEVYLTKQRYPLKRVYLDVVARCKRQGVVIPHFNTVRNRAAAIRKEKVLRFRQGNKAADDQYETYKSNFPGADFPLAVVQIDHTPGDVILVDDKTRTQLGKPWITMAIDVYSRMVVGFYVSFESPGALGVGMCIANSILPKNALLEELDVQGEWPCWGRMKKIYADNGKEFRSNMLKRACEEYGMDLEWRPVRKANYGGHIERLLGTFAQEIHSLPGTTFSNTQERGEYRSAAKAALTLREFEKWLLHLIVNIYHKRKHKALECTPLQMFEDGIHQKTGLQPYIRDKEKVKLDFLPFVSRTIGEGGIVVDYIHYQADVLRTWVHTLADDSPKSKKKQKFIFKRDPRDISVLFFYDPEVKTYFDIPYRDIWRPPITLWEHRQVLTKLANTGVKDISEDMLFDAYVTLQAIEEKAVTQTRIVRHQRQKARTQSNRAKSIKQELGISKLALTDQVLVGGSIAESVPVRPAISLPTANILPFDELEYGTFD